MPAGLLQRVPLGVGSGVKVVAPAASRCSGTAARGRGGQDEAGYPLAVEADFKDRVVPFGQRGGVKVGADATKAIAVDNRLDVAGFVIGEVGTQHSDGPLVLVVDDGNLRNLSKATWL